MPSARAIEGCLLGMAIGDALGLPLENMTPRRAARMFGDPGRFHFVFGRGMVSDDTEHACMTAQAMIAAAGDEPLFARQLARQLRLWLLMLPAGTGKATAQACLKLLVGIPAERSGVFSAGNGPAMRSPILGAAIDDLEALRRFVRISTRITHTDPKAEYAALAVALAAHRASQPTHTEPEQFAQELRKLLADPPAVKFLELVDRAVQNARQGESAVAFAESLGLGRGVAGYIYHTVPVVLQAWFRHPRDFRAAIVDVLACGGDSDTTAAILGGIVGAGVGKEGLPAEWLSGIWEWPRSTAWIEKLARELHAARSEGVARRPPRVPAWGSCPATFCSWRSCCFTGSAGCCLHTEASTLTVRVVRPVRPGLESNCAIPFHSSRRVPTCLGVPCGLWPRWP